MLQNRPNISPYSISPHSKWNVPRAFVGFWGDGTEPGNYFQSYFVFLRFALNVWNDYQVYYCISSMIYISLGQDLCNVAVEGLRWGLPTSSTNLCGRQFMLWSESRVQEVLSSSPSPLHAWRVSRRCRMLCFQTLLWAHGLNFHQSWRQGGRWLRWHKSRAGEKSSLYPAASSLTGEEGSPICSGSARACKIALAQICAHPIWHGCVGMTAEEPCDPKRALFFSHAIISSGNTCLCSLVLLQPISTWKAVTICT